MSATVLCIQEDLAVCEVYANALRAEGYEAIPAGDGGQALEILRRHQPDFVVLDVSLPRQGGLEILAALRRMPANRSLPVLMLCKNEITPELEGQAKRLGAIGLVSAPIDASALLRRVAQFVKPTRSGSPMHAVPPEQGSLKETSFPELMHRLHRSAFDGVLLLEHGRKKKAIELREGWPVCVKSNLISECLGAYLVRNGRCSQSQLDESVERMRAGEGMQGEILVAMDVLDEDAVMAAVEAHALAKLFEIFGWLDGRFQIRAGARIQRGTSIGIGGHPIDLIVEGVRRRTPLRWVDRFIECHSTHFLIPVPELESGLQTVELDAPEIEWIGRLDGTLALQDVAAAPESIRRLVFALIHVELLRVMGATGNPEAARAVARSAARRLGEPGHGHGDEEALRTELARLANRMQGEDHYAVLEVSAMASDEEIGEAYARMAAKAHPDLFHGASSSVRQLAVQVFGRIREAFDGIATQQARDAYAKELSQGRRVAPVEDEGRRALQAETEFQRGEQLVLERNYESALACFGRAMENFPAEGEYRAHYGWCLYLCHPDNAVMLGEALEHCREGLKLAKDREKPYLLLGRLYKAMGKPGAAKKMFTRAVQIKPQCVEAMRELRIMDMRRGKEKGVLKRLFRR